MSILRNASSFRRHVWKLFGLQFFIALGATLAVILIAHWRLGDESPGFWALMIGSLSSYAPILMGFLYVVPSIHSMLLVRKLRALARPHGLTWYEYIDLSAEARKALEDTGRSSQE